ncbi:lantibiotic dehydratase [Actinokineospora diospyrosa]|uniref:DisB n=1 Tax=Actinokineospora diospyrosa TaxID=103728 RepID=A0A8G1A4Y4_9PSEU|nr:lantibiotic dehydratase [Actinokineospora diospyrosa]MCP2271564.1 thiopeptide-type bacteriocin biosynthesis domain-containing protein [Actinokineospora diospyrosa]QYZ85379.1 DisB [Actinokineospora diospyrosa]
MDPLLRAWPVFLVRAPLVPEAGGPGVADQDDHLGVLRAAVADPVLTEAITLASPTLGAVLARVAAGGAAGLKAKQVRRAALSVLRYDIRTRTRPTPFGLFAGVSAGGFGAPQVLRGSAHRHRTHVDMSWLARVVHRAEADPGVLAGLRVRAHQALVHRGDRVVLETPSGLGAVPGQTTRSFVSARRSPVVAAALALAATPIAVTDLVAVLAERFAGGAAAPAAKLVRSLVEQELLITDLRPPLDGGDPLRHVLSRLPEGDLRTRLTELDRLREKYDALAPGEGTAALVELVDAAREVEPFDTPLHVDTRVDLRVTAAEAVREEVERAATVLWRLSPPRLGMRPLRGFHGRFLERYGADRLVPVLELLDTTRSLGAPPGYEWPPSEAVAETAAEPSSTRRDRAVSRLVLDASRTGSREAVLTDEVLAELAHDDADPADLPNSCELYVHVVERADGDFRVVLSPSPGSHHAGATTARFHDLLPHWPHEPHPVHVEGAVLADLAFTPRSGRAANLAHTPPTTGRRIAVGLPDAPGVEEIPLAEVAVGATLERLYAVHVPTGRELVPVLPNMVSPAVQAPNAIRLLFELGMEGQRLWEPWNWGPMANAPFLPRVRYGRSILAPATWRLDELRGHDDEADFDAGLARWREQWAVPDRVLLVSTDQRLLVHLDNRWHRRLLRDELRRDPDLIAQEVAGGDETVGDGHTRELVVALVPRPHRARPPHVAHVVDRPARSPLAGDWLYLLVHGSRQGQDDLLRDEVPALVRLAADTGADRWFFIRYTDADGHHLRLRFHGDPALLWSRLLPAASALLARWQEDGLVGAHRVQPYEPELERYGGIDALEAAERVFCEDSAAAIALLRLAKSSPFSLDALGAISVASLAHAFGHPPPGTPWITPTGEAAESWLTITGTRRDLPQAYRADPARWQGWIDPAAGWPGLGADGAPVLAALAARDAAVRDYARLVADLIAEGRSAAPLARVVGSLLHMTCNRLLGGSSERERAVLGIARGAVQDNGNRRRHRA